MTGKIMPILTEKRLKSLLKYEPDTGVWTWLMTRNHRSRAGSRAGTIHRNGYRIIEIDGRSYRSSRLAYLYMTGNHSAELIDHIDHKKDNDAWVNLRQASHNQNQYNQKMRVDNTSGVKGVRWEKQAGKWRADIKFQGKSMYLGLFTTLESAAEAVASTRAALHKEFACNGLKDGISDSHPTDAYRVIENDGREG